MILISCVDNNMGIAFNHRRQSRDAVLCQDILTLVQDAPLWMDTSSANLFPDAPDNVRVDDDYLTCAGEADYCFAERIDPASVEQSIQTIVLYRWNRDYPADVYFTLDLDAYEQIEQKTFVGKSHPEIVREIWTQQ